MSLEGIDDVECSDSLSLGVLGVGDRVSDDVWQERTREKGWKEGERGRGPQRQRGWKLEIEEQKKNPRDPKMYMCVYMGKLYGEGDYSIFQTDINIERRRNRDNKRKRKKKTSKVQLIDASARSDVLSRKILRIPRVSS